MSDELIQFIERRIVEALGDSASSDAAIFTLHLAAPVGAYRELIRLARLGAAVEAMPPNASLRYCPLNSTPMVPAGSMPWIFERPGEATTDAQDPLTALTAHTAPASRGPQSV